MEMDQTQAPQGKKPGMSQGAIVAIVVGVLVAALLVSVGIWAWVKNQGGGDGALGQGFLSGTISESERTAQNANARAIKSYAMVEIMTQEDGQGIPQGAWGWKATATVDETGNIDLVSVVPADSAVTDVMPEDGVTGEYIVGIASLD